MLPLYQLHDRRLTKSRCHGPAISPEINDPAAGKPIISSKKITGFTTQAEYDMKVMDMLRSCGEPVVDEHAKALGAECEYADLIRTFDRKKTLMDAVVDVRAPGIWDDFHVFDRRIVTRMNPQSAKSTMEAVVKVFDGMA